MTSVIVTESREDWFSEIDDVEIVDPREYLTDPDWSRRRNVKVYNLSNSYSYQSLGYYVSLLAEARGHRPLPGVIALQDLQGLAAVQFVSEEVQELVEKSLSSLQTDSFTLSVYFGRNMAKRYERLSRELYNLFAVPLLRFQFSRGSKRWRLRRVEAIPVSEIPKTHVPFMLESAKRHFEGRVVGRTKKSSPRYDLAILHDPNEGELAPSDPKALEKIIRAAASVGLAAHLITRQDAGRLLEFDALFIRQTTSVNHYTYRMARRAEREGLVVMDDPTSIARCTNKVYLAELLERHNVAAPKTIVAHRGSIDRLGAELGWPIVIKRPDGAFSQGVVKVKDQDDLNSQLESFFSQSELVIAQEYLPTAYDWRIGILDGRPLFACKYHMARGHWQIISHDAAPKDRYGKFETMAVEAAPRKAVAVALKAADLIGNGLYGVDVKETEGRFVIIEVNDNPNLDSGVEDQVLREELYRRIMEVFLRRIERKKMGRAGIMSDTTNTKPGRLNLFEAFGIELEYMVVDRETLAVKPIVADLLAEVTGVAGASDYIDGEVSWSNELVSHVVELKATEPVRDMRTLPPVFERALHRIDRTLAAHSAMLLPTAMHPSMDPTTETVLWPHENHEIYDAFHRVFNCHTHGWANVQSVHLNLPFNGDEQFGALHAAVRLVLPLLPAIASSSPIVDSHRNGINDNRLVHYREHCRRVPSITGDVIPEPIFDEATYRREIFERIFADIAPYDPDGILSHEFLNARGAIARFDRGSVEIRLMDVQECPMADVAIAAGVTSVVRALVEQTWQSLETQQAVESSVLCKVLDETISQGGRARIDDPTLLAAFGFPPKQIRASILWQNLLERLRKNDSMLDGLFAPLDIIFQHGTLAKRIFRATGASPSANDLQNVYSEIASCLRRGEPFVP